MSLFLHITSWPWLCTSHIVQKMYLVFHSRDYPIMFRDLWDEGSDTTLPGWYFKVKTIFQLLNIVVWLCGVWAQAGKNVSSEGILFYIEGGGTNQSLSLSREFISTILIVVGPGSSWDERFQCTPSWWILSDIWLTPGVYQLSWVPDCGGSGFNLGQTVPMHPNHLSY